MLSGFNQAKTKIMKIVVYTLPYAVTNEADLVNNLFVRGLEELHIRKPSFSRDDLFSFISAIDSEHHGKIVLHHCSSLMNDFKLKGLHFPRDYFSGFLGLFRRTKYQGKKQIQLSTSVTDMHKMETIDPIFHQVFVGPMYKKYSEQNSKSNFDAFEVKKAIAGTSKKVYAFGGIDLKNQKTIDSLGFEGIVLQASIWKSGDVVKAYQAFVNNQLAMEIANTAVKRA